VDDAGEQGRVSQRRPDLGVDRSRLIFTLLPPPGNRPFASADGFGIWRSGRPSVDCPAGPGFGYSAGSTQQRVLRGRSPPVSWREHPLAFCDVSVSVSVFPNRRIHATVHPWRSCSAGVPD
jgi:hypothetical protein